MERKHDRAPNVSRLQVIKKLASTARGAIKLSNRFGDSLVCVRYRLDPSTKMRYTTVELVVDAALVRPTAERMVNVKTELFEDALRARLIAAGAEWQPDVRLWRLPRNVAVELDLRARIISK